jgi:2,5-diketo-D-gluconate reductase B
MLAVKANGAVIPIVGLGTWDVRGKTCSRIVEQALRLGYRHIDTAQVYENEREVGEGVRASGIAREQVFVTTKVWWTHFSSGELERSVAESLARLKLGYVDLCCCIGRMRPCRYRRNDGGAVQRSSAKG